MALEHEDVKKLADAVNEEGATAPLRPHEIAKKRVEERTCRVVARIQRDKDKIMTLLHEEQQKLIEECRSGARPRHSFLPTVAEVFAKKMWDLWTEEEQLEADVYEGYCFVGRHQWFVVSGDPEEVEEPYWDFVIDPLPNGLLVFGASSMTPANVVVAPPMSLWAKNYLGAPEEMMRLSEYQDQVQHKIS